MKNLIKFSIMLIGLFCFSAVYGQNTITGKVVDESGLGIPGVSIYEEGNESDGTFSNSDGSFSVDIANNSANLILSFIGYQTQNLSIGDMVAKGEQNNLTITLVEDTKVLSEIFVSATSKPIRRLEATTAIESISSKEIERMSPVSLPDLVRFTPGLYVQTQAGRTRNFIFTRGFPDATGNGLVYTSLLMDGLRTFASPEAVPDAAFRQDLNIEKVEVVRGSAATLYGRGAAAGAINIISKMGGKETAGAVKATVGNNNWYQLDANLNGSLNASKSLRYNVGGFLLTDDGFRDNVFPDEGGQIRANIDYLFNENKSSLRVYGGYINLNVYNNLSIPFRADDLSEPAFNWTTRDAVIQPGNPFEGSSWPTTNPNTGVTTENTYDDDYRRGNFSEGFNIGAHLDLDLGNGWKLNNKLRYQDMTIGVGFDFAIDQNFGNSQTRIIFGGGDTDGGSVNSEIIDELRITKNIITGNAEHNIVIGGYLSRFNSLVSTVGSFYGVDISDADNVSINREPFGFPFNLIFRNGDYDENTTSVFLGDEMKFNKKFTLNAGVRYDAVTIDVTDNYQAEQENLNAVHDHSGASFSVGFNHLITPLTAIYGNVVRSFRAPDFASYTPVRFLPMTTTIDKPRVENNEQIWSFELGYRKSTDDWSFDGGLFNTVITDRVVPTFVGAIATQVPAGDNRITGAEVSFIYTPQNLKGFYARTSLTYQNASFTSFDKAVDNTVEDLSGNDLPNVPPILWNLSIGYENDRFGLNWNNNFIAARPVDIYNTTDYPSRSLMDANAYVKIVKGLEIKVGAQNLTNVSHAASVISAVTDNAFRTAAANGNTGDFANVRGVPYLPRRIYGSVLYRF